jgi:hypothetical protein
MPLEPLTSLIVRWPDAPEGVRAAAGVDALVGETLPDGFPKVAADGLWPGIRRPEKRVDWVEETASASREPWIDQNLYLYAYQRTLNPEAPAIQGYTANEKGGVKPDQMVPFESLEFALAEAWAMGGNWIAAPDERYRRALLSGDASATAAWKRFGELASWLKANRGLFGHPLFPTIQTIVEPGFPTRELANLQFRRSASPRLIRKEDLPAPGADCKAVVAASIRTPDAALRTKLLRHAEAGAYLVVDADWWKDARAKVVKDQPDRVIYSLGKGHVAAYKKRIADPSEFALDVIDFITYRNRPVRVWNANSVVPAATVRGREAVVSLVNYGQQTHYDVQLRVFGDFTAAMWHRPGHAAEPLEAKKRGTTTEVFLPELGRMSVIVFG